MKFSLDFKECLKDSPKFRHSLEKAEGDVEQLEVKLERVVKLCNTMTDQGKAFNNASSGFIMGVRDLANYFDDDEMVSVCLNKFCQSMSEMLKFFSILMDQAQRSVTKNLNTFIRSEIKNIKDTRKHFEKISDDMDSAMNRNSQAPKSKPQECEDAFNLMMANKSCFAHTSLDYVYQINILQSKKRFEVLETMLSFMKAQATFFHQGQELYQDCEPYMKDIANQVKELNAKAKVEWKEMERRHDLVQNMEIKPGPDTDDTDDLHMEGYLFKRTKHAFKTWVRRWFTIQQNQLRYQKRTKDHNYTIMEEDLRLCTVKPALEIDRRFCFEVLSPTRSHMLQAHTDEEFQTWVSAIQSGVTKAYRAAEKRHSVSETTTSPVKEESNVDQSTESPAPTEEKKSKAQIQMEKLYTIPGNSVCCDCGSPEPRWASINFGITLCIECSGIHRGFGVHVSKVRSITLDAWEPELLKVFSELGNDIVNRIYLVNVPDDVTRATPECNRTVRESWIRSKYITKAFVSKLPGPKLSESKVKGWRVKKKTRRSPARTNMTEEGLSPDSDVTSGLLEAVLSVSKDSSKDSRDSDSGLGQSHRSDSTLDQSDIMVFGTDTEHADLQRSFDLDLSENSSSSGSDEDTTSVTSWEDMSTLDPNMLLFKAAQARNLPVMLEALANSADPNWVCGDNEDKTPIMKAIETGSLAACEFLLLNGAKLDRSDRNGQTALHLATALGNTGQVCQFLKRGANLNVQDNEGKDPLSMAVSAANADIVTLLRLAKLNEEMKESDDYLGSNPGDETFNDVFRDFTNMASNNPEKLKRK